jgi:hypothetical protein
MFGLVDLMSITGWVVFFEAGGVGIMQKRGQTYWARRSIRQESGKFVRI